MSTFVSPADIDPITLAKSSDVNAIKTATATAFALLPTEAKLKQGTVNFAVDTGAANAYVAALDASIASYTDGLSVVLRPINSNTGAATINVNGLGVKSIRLTGGEVLSANDMVVGAPIELRYSTATGFFHLAPNSKAASTIATDQAVIATTQAGIATAQAVISTAQAGIATTQAGISTVNAAATAADLVLTNADVVLTHADAIATAADALATAADRVQTGLDAIATAADRVQTGIDAGTATTQAGLADTARIAAEAALDSFDDRYLGGKAADPALDNDGNALLTGALYWNSVAGQMRVYDGTAWQIAYLPSDSYAVGAASSTDGNVALFDGITGKIIKDSGLALSGTNTGDLTAASQAEMETGTETALRAMSPLRVKQAISANSDTATLLTAAFTMPATVTASLSFSISLTGTPLLVGASIASFDVTDWEGATTTVAAVANAGTKSLTATATVGQALSVSVVAIDNYGNRSAAVTHTTTVAAHAAPTGTITVNKPTSVLQSSTGNQISFSGGTATDGATITYQINASGSPQYTFSKTTAIASGEVVTFSAPALGAQTDISFTVQMNDSLGASSTPQSVMITTIIANIIGVAMTATGGNGGTFVHIDAAGNTITSPTAVTNNASVCADNPTFASHPAFAFTDVTIDGQAMVRVPAFYYKTGVISGGANDGKTAWWISDVPVAGFALHPAFMSENAAIAQFYNGKYQARSDGTKMLSTSGGTPAVSKTHTVFQAEAAARNTGGVTGFSVFGFWQLAAIQMLYVIENKTMDSQTKSGAGTTAAGAAVNVESAGGTYRGMVGLWGNVRQGIEGFKTLNGIMYTHPITGVKPTSSGADITGWVSQGSAIDVTGGAKYPITFKSSGDLGAAFIAATDTATLASGTVPDATYYYNNVTTTEYIPRVGGNWADGSVAGLWTVYCNDGASHSGPHIGSRLAKV